MLIELHQNKKVQAVLGLCFGVIFGFLLQKSGLTNYNVIVGQLLLTDFTVIKTMLSAVIIGMIGFHLLKKTGLVKSHIAIGSLGSNLIGGLIFGCGFALLGYGPESVSGAIGQGALDALFGGFIGILIGAGLFAKFYSVLNDRVLHCGEFSNKSIPQLLNINEWCVVIPFSILSVGFFLVLEYYGL
ncbi:MAG: YeeE/YedE thiosulfate transporter family protein [Methanoregulaceae archaeon]|jgi:hypothetical protein